jgi:hypothetical protein
MHRGGYHMARILLLLSALAIGGIAAMIYTDAENELPIQDDLAIASAFQTRPSLPMYDANTQTTIESRRQTIEQPAPASTHQSVIIAKKVVGWIADTSNEDPSIRAAAIDALGNAPKSKAVPVLLNVLRSGINNDRQLALDSLHTLALEQGDENEAIRTALRLVIYDGDDETMISGAQIALEDIEYDLPPPANTKHSTKTKSK